MIVEVYRNLHKSTWSIRNARTRRVQEHLDQLELVNCTFVVYESGRQRVIHEQRKNVHAFVRGEMVTSDSKERSKTAPKRLRYNPYKCGSFVVAGQPCKSAARVIFDSDGRAYVC